MARAHRALSMCAPTLAQIPGIDLQPCGGTHVKNIAEIGAIRVLKIRSEGKRNKRVEIALSS